VRRKRNNGDAAVATPTGPNRVYEFADSVAVASEPVAPTAAVQRLETWVTFVLAGERYGLPVATVNEVLRVGTVTRVPHAPRPVRGIVNVRGRIVPVVDLRTRISLPAARVTGKSRILIATARERVVGLLVDEVERVARLDRNTVEPPPEGVMTAQSEYLIGVYRRDEGLLILLDTEKVLVIPAGSELGVEPKDGDQ
jgi:purine-binding chemotaxis protein CheW